MKSFYLNSIKTLYNKTHTHTKDTKSFAFDSNFKVSQIRFALLALYYYFCFYNLKSKIQSKILNNRSFDEYDFAFFEIKNCGITLKSSTTTKIDLMPFKLDLFLFISK